jgi:hypothetical protein
VLEKEKQLVGRLGHLQAMDFHTTAATYRIYDIFQSTRGEGSVKQKHFWTHKLFGKFVLSFIRPWQILRLSKKRERQEETPFTTKMMFF